MVSSLSLRVTIVAQLLHYISFLLQAVLDYPTECWGTFGRHFDSQSTTVLLRSSDVLYSIRSQTQLPGNGRNGITSPWT